MEVKGGKLYINGAKQDEPFTAEDAAYDFGPVTVPSGNVLVLGDNRNHSLDGESSFKIYFFHLFYTCHRVTNFVSIFLFDSLGQKLDCIMFVPTQ